MLACAHAKQVWIVTIQFFECLNVATQTHCATYLGERCAICVCVHVFVQPVWVSAVPSVCVHVSVCFCAVCLGECCAICMHAFVSISGLPALVSPVLPACMHVRVYLCSLSSWLCVCVCPHVHDSPTSTIRL